MAKIVNIISDFYRLKSIKVTRFQNEKSRIDLHGLINCCIMPMWFSIRESRDC